MRQAEEKKQHASRADDVVAHIEEWKRALSRPEDRERGLVARMERVGANLIIAAMVIGMGVAICVLWRVLPDPVRATFGTLYALSFIALVLSGFKKPRNAPRVRPNRPALSAARSLAGSLKIIRDDERAQFDAMHIQAMCLALLRIADTRSGVYDEAAAYLMVDALARVGNAHAATWLERMAWKMFLDRRSLALRRAAERAAATIRERIAREHAGDTLLRPAAPAEADSLLRPARGGEEREPELLLRPTNTQDDATHAPGG